MQKLQLLIYLWPLDRLFVPLQRSLDYCGIWLRPDMTTSPDNSLRKLLMCHDMKWKYNHTRSQHDIEKHIWVYNYTLYCWCIDDSILADMSHQLNVYGGSLKPGRNRVKVMWGMEDLRLFQACFHPLLFINKNAFYFEPFAFSSL